MSSSSDPSLQVNQLPISIDFTQDDERFKDTLSLWAKRVANAVNTKEGSLYSLQEFFNFKLYYTVGDTQNFRNTYRKCFDLVDLNGGNIGPATTVAFPHGITGLFEGTLIYAGCTSVTPTYFSVMGQPTIYLDSVNINFTNPLPVALTAVLAVCEYLKN